MRDSEGVMSARERGIVPYPRHQQNTLQQQLRFGPKGRSCFFLARGSFFGKPQLLTGTQETK